MHRLLTRSGINNRNCASFSIRDVYASLILAESISAHDLLKDRKSMTLLLYLALSARTQREFRFMEASLSMKKLKKSKDYKKL